jgi:hypothetical protein
MSDPNIFDRQGNGPSIRAGLGAICVMFLALAIWQSKATSQSAHPVEADAGLSAPRSIAQQPKRSRSNLEGGAMHLKATT